MDGVTWQDYGQDLEENLRDLHARVQQGRVPGEAVAEGVHTEAGRAAAAARVAALEDKILQRAVVEVLNAIYEQDFLGFSYGFRPGR